MDGIVASFFFVKIISIKFVIFHTCSGSSGRAVTGWGSLCECYYSNPDWLPGEIKEKWLDIWKVLTTANSLRPILRNQWVVQRCESEPACPNPVSWNVGTATAGRPTHTAVLSFFRLDVLKIMHCICPVYFMNNCILWQSSLGQSIGPLKKSNKMYASVSGSYFLNYYCCAVKYMYIKLYLYVIHLMWVEHWKM